MPLERQRNILAPVSTLCISCIKRAVLTLHFV